MRWLAKLKGVTLHFYSLALFTIVYRVIAKHLSLYTFIVRVTISFMFIFTNKRFMFKIFIQKQNK